jgi:FtsP/CotA-like multicopper oxidase with cupredoxin domain
MTSTFTFDAEPAAGATGLTCEIPADGTNTPRLLTVADGLPVVLRDPIPNQQHFEAFGCNVRKANPPTPDQVEPDVAFTLGVHTGARVDMPDGTRVNFMSFHPYVADDPDGDDDATKIFPGPLMRVREGQVVHTTLVPSRNTHTVHHHGIEPIPHNDGVGHTSFEVSDRYTYQWKAASSGSYFYHCHKNTVLHFEMGMYGPLIVDPPEGPGFVRRGAELVRYDHEVEWIPDDIDPRWHDLDHMAGMLCPWDTSQHLLRFEPRYWLLTGVPHPRSRAHPDVAVTCRVGEVVLLRLLNAAYGPVVVDLPFDAECINVDGHTLGGPKDHRYSRPYTIPAHRLVELSTAQRYDLLVRPDRTGVFTVPFHFQHWVRGTSYGLTETTITVTS